MIRALVLEKSPFISDFLQDTFSLIACSNYDDAKRKIERFKPDIVVIDENFDKAGLLDFCLELKNLFGLPVFLIANFYSTLDMTLFQNIGVDVIVKPFTKDELLEKLSGKEEKKEPVSFVPAEIMESLKPYIQDEIRKEVKTLFKKLTEVVESKYA